MSATTTHHGPRAGSSTPSTARAAGLEFWRTLGRHQVGALVATGVDFLVMVAAVELVHMPAAFAAAFGAVCGAVTNFLLGRRWVFHARSGAFAAQAARYAAVSAASAGWNALGEYFLHDGAHVEYVVARVVVSLVVGLAWNYPLQRGFVFRRAKAIEAG
jgi:putative flippase GtrA